MLYIAIDACIRPTVPCACETIGFFYVANHGVPKDAVDGVFAATRRYFDRSVHWPGMVTGAVVRAFASIGWGWGGSWAGSTKDYMHFSATGH